MCVFFLQKLNGTNYDNGNNGQERQKHAPCLLRVLTLWDVMCNVSRVRFLLCTCLWICGWICFSVHLHGVVVTVLWFSNAKQMSTCYLYTVHTFACLCTLLFLSVHVLFKHTEAWRVIALTVAQISFVYQLWNLIYNQCIGVALMQKSKTYLLTRK